MEEKRLHRLAKDGKLVGLDGSPKSEESVWHIEAIPPAKQDGYRLFRNNPGGLAVAIDQIRCLAVFPDRHAIADGEVLDLNYKKLQGEVFYRLRIDDESFGRKSLRVFFWPQGNRDPRTIWVIGAAWRSEGYAAHILARCRRRQRAIIAQTGGKT